MNRSVAKTKEDTKLTPQMSPGLNVFDQMEKMFENFSTSGWLRPFHWDTPAINDLRTSFETNIPSVDIIEDDGDIIVKALMPGIEKKDIDISLTKNTVTIKGESSHEEKGEKGEYYRHEISKGSYLRTMTLPSQVDDSKAKAKFKDGVLELKIPKLEETKRSKVKID